MPAQFCKLFISTTAGRLFLLINYQRYKHLTFSLSTNYINRNELMKSTLADAPAALDPLASFLPKLVNALTVEDSRQRTFLLGWISLLDALPHADALLLRALPHITPGLLTFLGDEENEVQTAANKLLQQLLKDIAGDPGKVDVAALASSLIDWLAENEDSIDDNTSMMMMMSAFTTDGGSRKSSTTKPTAIRYIQTLVAVAPLQLSGIAASVLHTCLRCLDTSDDAEIQSLGAALNEQLFSAEELLQRADLGSLLAVAAQGIGAMHETARLEALRWTAALLRRSSNATVNSNANSSPPQLEPAVLPALCDALSSTSDRVVQQSVAVLAAVSGTGALKSVLGCFKGAPGQQLLQRRGAAIIEQLCKIMGACNVLVVVSDLLAEENDFDFEFARMMAQAVSLILCTSPQLEEARCLLASAADDPAGAAFLTRLLRGLCFSVTGALSVAFLAGAYILASEIISQLTKQPFIGDMSASVVELSSLVSLLEAPVFAGMRLQLLTPRRCPALLRALYSLLLILPCQGEAFRQLRQRLDCVPGRDVYNDDGEVKKSSAMSFSKEKKNLIDAESLLATFIQVQMRKLSP